MGFNSGTGSPSAKGDDEQTWRELVARLEASGDGREADAGARDAEGGSHGGGSHGGGSGVGDGVPGQGATGTSPSHAGTPAHHSGDAPGPKGVADFDPLGVWQQNPAPAPTELPAGERSPAAAAGPRDYEAPEGDDDGFVPEEPPSLSSSEPAILLSWLGAAGGPLFLVFAAIFWRSIPLVVTIAVIMAFLGGTGYLLSRLPNHRDHDGGDGAVV